MFVTLENIQVKLVKVFPQDRLRKSSGSPAEDPEGERCVERQSKKSLNHGLSGLKDYADNAFRQFLFSISH